MTELEFIGAEFEFFVKINALFFSGNSFCLSHHTTPARNSNVISSTFRFEAHQFNILNVHIRLIEDNIQILRRKFVFHHLTWYIFLKFRLLSGMFNNVAEKNYDELYNQM